MKTPLRRSLTAGQGGGWDIAAPAPPPPHTGLTQPRGPGPPSQDFVGPEKLSARRSGAASGRIHRDAPPPSRAVLRRPAGLPAELHPAPGSAPGPHRCQRRASPRCSARPARPRSNRRRRFLRNGAGPRRCGSGPEGEGLGSAAFARFEAGAGDRAGRDLPRPAGLCRCPCLGGSHAWVSLRTLPAARPVPSGQRCQDGAWLTSHWAFHPVQRYKPRDDL